MLADIFSKRIFGFHFFKNLIFAAGIALVTDILQPMVFIFALIVQ